MGDVMAFAVSKTKAVLALVWAAKGWHVLINTVELQAQQLGTPVFQARTLGRLRLGGGFPRDRTGAFRGFSFAF
jgi:hypothetical protein